MSEPTSHLIEFYGTDCHFCVEMAPDIERLEKEENIVIEKFEVWNNDENAKLLEKYDTGICGGVPFFVNTKTNKYICGYADYEGLKKWALGE